MFFFPPTISVLAKLPNSVLTKMIYQERHVIAESNEGYVNYNYGNGQFMDFEFLSSKNYLSIQLTRKDPLPDGFVVEALKGEKYGDCSDNVVPWLKKWLFRCKGNLQVRNLTMEEKNQMQAYINEPAGRPSRRARFKLFFSK